MKTTKETALVGRMAVAKRKLAFFRGSKGLQQLGQVQGAWIGEPRLEMAPGHLVGVVLPVTGENSPHQYRYEYFKWGLEPAWWDSSRHEGHSLFTARVETIGGKPSFREALARRRCLVPVDGFWFTREVGEKTASFLVRPRKDETFLVPAVWEIGPDGPALALITTEAAASVKPLSQRLPAVVKAGDEHLWLDPHVTEARLVLGAVQPLTSRRVEIVPTDPEERGIVAMEPVEDAEELLTALYGHERLQPGRGRAAVRRLVRRDGEAPGQVFFKTRSFTEDSHAQWHPVVDIEWGGVFCDCPDFRFRHARHEPDVWTPQFWCKHVARAVQNCRRHGQLPPLRSAPHGTLAHGVMERRDVRQLSLL